jgi:DNA-binding transcriptional regulator YbjK
MAVGSPDPAARPGRDQRPRRQAILDATLRLLRSGGPGAITHRAVAREAGVPLAATTYYFASKDHLLAEALDELATEELRRLEAITRELREARGTGDPVPAAAAAIAHRLVQDVDPILLQFEIYVEAARRPGIGTAARARVDAFERLAEEALREAGATQPEAAAKLFIAAVDGLVLHRLASTSPPDAAEIQELLTELLTGLLR